jgi:hypothetical protein
MVLLSTAAGHIAFFYAVVSVRSMFLLSLCERKQVYQEKFGVGSKKKSLYLTMKSSILRYAAPPL